MTATTQASDKQKLIFLAALGLVYSLGIAYLFQSLPNQRYTDDFYPRWYASRNLLTIERGLYDEANAIELVGKTGWPFPEQLGYYYPAYLLSFTAPLSLLPYRVARAVWTVFGLWSLWLAMVIFAKFSAPTLSTNRLTVLLVLATTSVPVIQHTLNAQFNSPGILALALAYQALYQRRFFQAGLWAGGMLFKPQATLVSLLFFSGWSAFKKERWRFLFGLGLIGLIFWLIGEVFERNWLFHFLDALGGYIPVRSVADQIFNPLQITSIILLALTVWFVMRLKNCAAGTGNFSGLLVWTMSVNAIIIPLYGMLHMVMLGPLSIILLGAYTAYNRRYASWIWWGTIAVFIIGLAVFIVGMVLSNSGGLQITLSEGVYRFAAPILMSLLSLPLIFQPGCPKLNQ